MTERIDHASEAVNFLRATTFDTHGDDDRKVALAQVHATLALVEQQRIANLIALGEAAFPDGSRVYTWAVVVPGEHVDSYRLRADVREGLGL